MPLTLHAAWLHFDASFPDGQLFFWAETTDNFAQDRINERINGGSTDVAPINGSESGSGNGIESGSANGGGRPRSTKIPSHPFQASAGQVRALLAHIIPDLKTATLQPTNMTVWLPTAMGAPVTRRGVLQQSADLQGVQTIARSTVAPVVTLEPWQVTGVTLPALDVLATLGHLDSHTNDGGSSATWRRFRLGNDLLFWSNAAKLALEFLAGQNYLPTIRTSPDGRFYAVWQPALLDNTLQWRIDQLTAMMPPVCRAYELGSLAAAPTPAGLLEHFLAAMVDGAVRHWVHGEVGDEAAQAAFQEKPAQQWLYHLTGAQRQIRLSPLPRPRTVSGVALLDRTATSDKGR